MKLVLQRVDFASVSVEGKVVGSIGKGLLVLVGVSRNFTEEKLDWMIKKTLNLRLWSSDKKGFDLSVKGVNGMILVVSQFTLHGIIDGNKPNFKNSAQFETAKEVYEKYVKGLKEEIGDEKVQTGKFGSMMRINLENDGPVTIVLEK